MSYQKTTIRRLVADIDQKKVFLPALQRKFVWGRHQITLLFDSLMRNYPFGAFLFWRLPRQKAAHYVFYDFLTRFDVREPYNKRKQGAFTHDEIIGVLDGQQRLSSMYVGLLGSHIEKAPYKHWTNPDAFEETWLYLNLLDLPYQVSPSGLMEVDGQDYPFAFRSAAAAAETFVRQATPTGLIKRPACWFKVGDVLQWDEEPDFEHVIDQLQTNASTVEQKAAFSEQRRSVRKGLEMLHKRICGDELINYFEVTKDDLEDILNIFVRVNSGGTVLSKTDLLFSTIVATWDDGRERIEALERRLNETGEGFAFGNEFLMRASLMLTDAPISFRVQSFKSENVATIRDSWTDIADALSKTVGLLYEFGFNGVTLTSQNAALVIAYHIHKGGQLDANSKEALRQYLLRSLLLGVYGASQDQVLTTFRNALRAEHSASGYTLKSPRFNFEALARLLLPQGRTLAVTEADLERFLDYTKGFGGFAVLSLLYPHLRFNEVSFHQDHIHPFSRFQKRVFDEFALTEEQREKWLVRRDSVPNLQLLEGKRNQSKNDTPLADWLGRLSAAEVTKFKDAHYFPANVKLEFAAFIEFYEARRALLRARLAEIFGIAGKSPVKP